MLFRSPFDSYAQVDLRMRARSESVAAGMTATVSRQNPPNISKPYWPKLDRGVARSSLGDNQGAIALVKVKLI